MFSRRVYCLLEQTILNYFGDGQSFSTVGRICFIVSVILLAFLLNAGFNQLITPFLQRFSKKTNSEWEETFFSANVCRAFAALIPPALLYTAIPFALQEGAICAIVLKLFRFYLNITVCLFFSEILTAGFNYFERTGGDKVKSLRGVSQMLQILLWIVGTIMSISILIDRSPWTLFTGLGALATVLLLIFSDSIKGLVAGIQLSVNDMVRVGDWITIPHRNVNGIVKEITLSTIKVSGWDNTTFTVMPYTLLTDTFQNWRSMMESEGRRMKSDVHIDLRSVKYLTEEEIQQLKEEGILTQPIIEKITNLQAYRKYILQYLENSPFFNTEMMYTVRVLDPTQTAISLEVYAFSRAKDWKEYEDVSASLISFLLMSMPKFGICPLQR